jgi:hypothetical protein
MEYGNGNKKKKRAKNSRQHLRDLQKNHEKMTETPNQPIKPKNFPKKKLCFVP